MTNGTRNIALGHVLINKYSLWLKFSSKSTDILVTNSGCQGERGGKREEKIRQNQMDLKWAEPRVNQMSTWIVNVSGCMGKIKKNKIKLLSISRK